MTCIVGVVAGKNVFIGGDRAATDNELNRTIIKHPKVFVKSGIGFGFCGAPKALNAIQYGFDLPVRKPSDNVKVFLNSQLVPALREGLKGFDCTTLNEGQHMFEGALLIGCGGELHQMECNFQLIESSTGFDAVGSGAEPAIGSLYETRGEGAKKRILKALETSAKRNAGVAPPFDVICV